MKLAGTVVLVIVGITSALSVAQAQQPPAIRLDVASVRDGAYPNASAVVNYEDSTTGASALGAKNFSVTIDGKAVAVAGADLASSQELPLDVLFVMDTSGSMAGEPLARAKEAAQGFIGGLAPNDRVALVSFNDRVQLVEDFTLDRPRISAAIEALQANGNTALYQATAATAVKVSTSPARRRAAIFLSDGAEDGVPATVLRDDAIAAAAGAGVPYFTVGEGNGIDRRYLQQLAEVTHGRYLEAPAPKDLAALYAAVGQLLRSQYVVTFEASGVAEKGSSVAVTVTTDRGSATATIDYAPGGAFLPPALAITGLESGDSVTEPRTIGIAAAIPGGRASYVVDGVSVFESLDPPYSYVFDPRSFQGGEHRLSVSFAAGGKTARASISFSSVVPPPRAPSGGLPKAPIAVGVGIGLVVAILFFLFLRVRAARRGDAPDAGRVVAIAKPLPTKPAAIIETLLQDDSTPAAVVGEALGVLISLAGTDLGQEYPVGGSPVSIGSSAACAVHVPDAELTAEEARIWIRKGHLMVHKMTRLTAMVVDGTSGGWQILEPGDAFTIGRHKYEFRLLRENAISGDAAASSADVDAASTSVADMPRSGFSDLMPRSD